MEKLKVCWISAFRYVNGVHGAKLEREVGASCIKGVFLDELEPGRGRLEDEVFEECGIMCYLATMEQG